LGLWLLVAACSGARPRVEPAPRLGAAAAVPTSGDATLDYLRSRELMVPVDGVRVGDVPDNFSAGRQGRAHNAHDIMAERGTPVLAADDGRIIRIARNTLGGLTIYASDPQERLVYYYAHLDRYKSGIEAGMRVSKGQVIGFVGSSGNASPNAPHLHFQVARLVDISRHWEGEPLDARPYFVLDGKRR
jgi:murein DD-endopeptidase MepM/ murein hydrolase activator NlpD